MPIMLLTYARYCSKLNLKVAYVINLIEAKEVKTMPRMDGTGPMMGFGARGGSGRRICLGNPCFGKGMRFGHGFGRRMGSCRMQSESVKDRLLAHKSMLQEELNAVDEELAKM